MLSLVFNSSECLKSRVGNGGQVFQYFVQKKKKNRSRSVRQISQLPLRDKHNIINNLLCVSKSLLNALPKEMNTLVRIALNFLVASIAIAGGIYQLYLKPLLYTLGYSPTRIIELLGNQDCKTIPELKACESPQFFFFTLSESSKKG